MSVLAGLPKKIYHVTTRKRTYDFVRSPKHFQRVRQLNHDNSKVEKVFVFKRGTPTPRWVESKKGPFRSKRSK